MRLGRGLCFVALLLGCGETEMSEEPPGFVVVTFNTGTNDGLGHDNPPDDGYTSVEAAYSDQYYGDGLAWTAVIDDVRAFFAQTQVDIVAFQEIFHSEDCVAVPVEARAGFVCENWNPGDPTVVQRVVGDGFQVACHVGHPDKCVAVRTSFGRFAGCEGGLCVEGLAGSEVPDCGSGARVGWGVIDLVLGGSLTIVNIHGTSGIEPADMSCRLEQFRQVFVDAGDGMPAARGDRNVVLGDLNTDPIRAVDIDPSAQEWSQHVGTGKPFHYITAAGVDAEPSYAGLFNIDHVVSDAFEGSCWVAGITEGHPPVTETVYFDHKPAVCRLLGP